MDTEFGVNITANAAGVTPGVQQAESKLGGLRGILEQLNAGFASLASRMSGSMSEGVSSTRAMENAMDDLGDKTRRETANLKEMANSAHGGVEAFGSMKSMLMGVAASAVAALSIDAVARWAAGFADAAEKTDQLAQQFGMATSQVRQLDAVALTTGISIETMTKAMGLLDKKIFSAGEEGSKTSVLLKQMGLSAADAGDQMKILETVADKFAAMEDGPKKAALAMELFGKAGREMIPILNMGAKGIADLTEQARSYGLANSDLAESAQAKGAALDNILDENALAIAGLNNVMADAFLPVIGSVVTSMSAMTKALIDSYTEGGIVAVIFREITLVVEEVGAVIDALIGVFQALWSAVVDIVTAIVTDIADAFGVKTPGYMDASKIALNLFKDAFVILKDVLVITILIIKGGIVSLIDILVTLGKIAWDAFTLNWGAIQADWDRGLATIKGHALKTAGEIKTAYADLAQTMGAAMRGEGPKAAGGGGAPTVRSGGYEPPTTAGGGGGKGGAKAETRMSGWEEKLAEQRLAQSRMSEQQGTFQELSKQSEADYWKSILERTDLTHAEKLAVEKKYLGLRLEIRREEFTVHMAGLAAELEAVRGNEDARLRIAQQMLAETSEKYGAESKQADAARARVVQIERDKQRQIEQIQLEATKAHVALMEDAVAADEAAAQHRVDMGLDTDAELLRQEIGFENRRFQIRSQALQQLRTLVDPSRDPVRYAQLSAQIEDLERAHQARVTGIVRQQELQRTSVQRTAINGISSSWASSISRLLTLQQGFGETVKSLYMGLVNIIGGALSSIIEKWLQQQIVAFAVKHGLMAAENVASVTSNAAVAGAAAFASIAAIPIVGPGLAPAAAAAAFAGAMSFAPIASAAGGWDRVPMDGAMSMLHLDEMVLPASIASPLRSMLSDWETGPTGGASRASSGAPQPGSGQAPSEAGEKMGDVHIHLAAMDTKSGAKWLMDNRGALAASVRRAYQDGHR